MIEDRAPARRRRLGAHGKMFRRRRIFARLREGFTYEEIANEEGLSLSRIRQIVSQEMQNARLTVALTTRSCNWSVWRP